MSDVERVKSGLDIVKVIGSYIELQNAGSNFKGLCPFHNEKSPSFMVNPERQSYKCFGCGKGGDVLTFIQEIEKLEFPETLAKAADMAGIELEGNFKKNKELEEKKKKLYEINALAAKYFNHLLTTHSLGSEARKYIQKRKITSNELVLFNFGFAANNYYNLINFLNSKGYDNQILIEAGLVVNRGNDIIDKFRNRLMQPIYDLSGNIVGFSGRYLGENESAPKYLNSPESIIYKKKELLYSLFHAKESIRKSKYAILVEGNIDIVSSFRVGEQCVVAPLGTAITESQMILLKRFSEIVYFAFDNDTAGRNAIVKALEIAERIGLNHGVINVSPYQDSDELICSEPELWTKKVSEPIETMDFLIDYFSSDLDMGSVEGKLKFKRKIIPVLRTVKDKVRYSHYLKSVSLILEMTQEELKAEIESVKISFQHKAEETSTNTTERMNPEKKQLTLEKLFVAMVIATGNFDYLVNINEAIESKELIDLAEILFEVRSKLDEAILSTLDSEHIELYNELVSYDFSDQSDLDKELEKLKNRLLKETLKKKILHLRSEIALRQEDETLLQSLKTLVEKMKNL